MKINRTKIGKWKTGMVVLTVLKGRVINLNFDNNASLYVYQFAPIGIAYNPEQAVIKPMAK